MEFPEDPRGESRSEGHHSPQAQDRETEAWLRRELAFLHGVERRILRRARMRREAWRAAAVALILAIFACCWYLAALGSGSASGTACPANSATGSSVAAQSGAARSGAVHSGAESPGAAGAAAVPGLTGHAHAGASADGTASGCA